MDHCKWKAKILKSYECEAWTCCATDSSSLHRHSSFIKYLLLCNFLVSSLLLSFGPCCRLVLFFSLASWLLALIFFLFLALDFLFWFLALFALADFLFLLFLLLPLDFLIWFLALAVGFLLAVPVSSSQLCSCVTFSSASCSCLLVFCCGVLISQLDFC